MPVTLRFFGAVGTVTGSRFLLECDDEKILVDAGLFQGLRELRDRNWDPFPVEVSKISAVVITHAHLDHCGYLPRLIGQGFTGKIHMTHYTAKLAAVVLRDSASLQVEDAKYAKKKGYSKHKDPKPLYSLEDAERAISLFSEHPYGESIQISKHGSVFFKRSGHILGSSSALINFFGKEVLFSGDLGRPHHPILQPPDPLPPREIDAVVIESTYGDRTHPAKSNDLADAINRTVKKGGTEIGRAHV